MDIQRLISLGIVAAALIYLGRQFVASAKAFFEQKSGCGGGCGKCAFAEQGGLKKTAEKGRGTAAPGNIIALGEIKTLPRRGE